MGRSVDVRRLSRASTAVGFILHRCSALTAIPTTTKTRSVTGEQIYDFVITNLFPIHDECFLNSIPAFSSLQTYGPSTVCCHCSLTGPAGRSINERARLLARYGLTNATTKEVRAVFPLQGGESPDTPPVDVPKDGKTISEIMSRRNIVMKECFCDPDATARAFRGGCFNSGDLAVQHLDEYITIMDWCKGIIISGGEVGVHGWPSILERFLVS